MELTRRDAVAALAAAGVAGGSAVVLSDGRRSREGDGGGRPLDDSDVGALVAVAEVLYPSAVENVGEFVARYARGRARERPEHARGVAESVAYLDDYAGAWHGEQFSALDPATRADTLREMNADTAEPDPEGSDVERVRYYLVNELLFALYSSPTGGELVGIENPQGHPGGLASYQRGPSQT